MIPISKPYIGDAEKRAVLQVLESGMLVQGPRVAELERRWAAIVGTKHAIATSNGTAALHAALLAHGIGPGDEVITTPFTFMASVNSILYCGATPVFCDVLPGCFNIDVSNIEALITKRTKALMPVHLYGHPANINAIMDIARRHNLIVIEDCAQSIGADVGGRMTGSFGIGCFSLYATKNVHSGEGGMITTNDDDVARRCRMIRAHGMERRYFHDMLGFNFRMSDLHAAIGLCQLDRMDELTAKRRANAEYLNANIRNPKVITPIAKPGIGHVWHQYTIRIVDSDDAEVRCVCDELGACLAQRSPVYKGSSAKARDEAVSALTRAGVGTGVFYPVPAHKQKHIVELGLGKTSTLPVAERLAQQVLSLPVHPMLTQVDLDQIIAAVNAL